ncbi:unnamed protein product [Urochloa decumbens]|uniref:Uncharacterized protein n=1 Tax=Urochloa decumbens TaxID=240449 RepID=A0ABC9AH65_9POAL
MADKMAHLPPVSLAKEEEAAAHLPAARFISVWALITSFAYALVYTLNRYDTAPCHPQTPVQCAVLTEAVVALVNALWNGMMWFAAPQAAAAALELLLPCRRRWMWTRRALACVAFAASIVSHGMFYIAAGVVILTVVIDVDPARYLSFTIRTSVVIFVLAVGDLLASQALLLVGDAE